MRANIRSRGTSRFQVNRNLNRHLVLAGCVCVFVCVVCVCCVCVWSGPQIPDNSTPRRSRFNSTQLSDCPKLLYCAVGKTRVDQECVRRMIASTYNLRNIETLRYVALDICVAAVAAAAAAAALRHTHLAGDDGQREHFTYWDLWAKRVAVVSCRSCVGQVEAIHIYYITALWMMWTKSRRWHIIIVCRRIDADR